MRLHELFENITPQELDHVEQIADALWAKLGVDVEFTRHFFDRVNDERNGRQITADELIVMFQKEFKTNGIQISNMRKPEAVLRDLLSNINIPFVLKRNGDEKELVAKTVMRKRDFKSSDPAYIVKELFDNGAAKWGWSYRGSEEVEASFGVGDLEYKFYTYTASKAGPGVWEVEFRISNPMHNGTRFGVSGTGNSAIVMSTIVSILKAFLQDYEGKVDKLVFSAKEDSRRKLYSRMVRRLLPTWGYEQTGGEFTLTKPEAGVIKPQSL